MPRSTLYLAIGLGLGLIALIVAGFMITADVAMPAFGFAAYIWAGAVVVLGLVVAFFIWLIRKGRPAG